MELVFCAGVKDIDAFLEMGIKKFEISGLDIYNLSEKELCSLKERIEGEELEITSLNGLMGNCKPLREVRDLSEAEAYLEELFRRLQLLGVKTVVFGSGGFRRVPEEKEDAFEERLISFVYLLCDKAKKYGITVALEPLNQKECNIFTTAKESALFVEKINRPEFKLLIDLYHFTKENEPISDLKTYGGMLKHVHIAHPGDRLLPLKSDGYDYKEFFCELQNIGYNGLISVEANRNGHENVKESYEYLNSLL